MRASTAAFASIVAICCTVGIVNSQIQFVDGSTQTTAYTGQTVYSGVYESTAVPPGMAFQVCIPRTFNEGNWLQISDPVPAGQELVILRISIPADSYYLSSRLNGAAPNYFEQILAQSTYNNGTQYTYPDGTIIVDEGWALWTESAAYQEFNPLIGFYINISIQGYYRTKS